MRRTPVLALALLSLLPLMPAIADAAAPAARLFDPVPDADRAFGTAWRAQACALLPQPCDSEGLSLLREQGAQRADALVLLATRPLARAELRRTADGWVLEALRDFSGYRPRTADPQRRAALSLARDLYPLGEGRWAVAVLLSVSESYSGGGAGFQRADFVPLDGAIGEVPASRADIPFFCTKTVRACFSEKEYRTSPHCHDESDGSLRIGYGAPAAPGGDYRWRYS